MFGRGRDEHPPAGGIELIPVDRAGAADAGWSIAEVADDRSRRRAGVVVGATVAVCIAAAATAGLVSSDDRGTRAGPSPSSSRVPDAGGGGGGAMTSQPAATWTPPTTEVRAAAGAGDRPTMSAHGPAEGGGFVLAHPPAGLEARGGRGTSPSFVRSGGSDVQLWASDGASRGTGRWLIVEVGRGARRSFAPPGHRVAGFDRGAMVGTAEDGVTTMIVDPPGPAVELAYTVSLTSRGVTEPELLAIASSITVDDTGAARLATPPAGLSNVLHSWVGALEPLRYDAVGEPIGSVDYIDPRAPDRASSRWLTIDTVRTTREDMTLLPFLVDELHPEWLGSAGEFLIGTAPDIEGHAPDEITVAFRREPGGTLIRVTTNVSQVALGAALPSLQRANMLEWAALIAEGEQRDRESADDFVPPTWARLIDGGAGTAGWSVDVARDRRWIHVMSGDGWSSTTSLDGASSPLIVVPGRDRTIVVAHAATGELATVRVLQDGAVVAEASVVAAFDGTAAIAAASFEQPGPFTVEAVAPDGSILHTGSY